MKHLFFVALGFALFFASSLRAQNYRACHTPPPQYAPVFEQVSAERSSANPYVVQIFVHILRDNDGSNAAMSDAVLQANLDDMASFFRPHNICFTFLGRDFIDNTTWNNDFLLSQIGDLHAVNPHADAIDMYIHRGSVEGSGGNAYDIPSSKCSIVASTPFNFEHEMGHCLGLLHTFETALGTECPDGSNCGGDGDLICDTAADFGGSEDTSPGCTYTGTQTIDCNGGTFNYNPPTTNVMSYWSGCYSNFTPNQGTRMRNTIDGTAFLQDRLTPDNRVVTGVALTGEIALGAQNQIQVGNIAALGNVTMNVNAHGIFNAGSRVKLVPGTHVEPTGANGILLTINPLCNGLLFSSPLPNEDRKTPAQAESTSPMLEVFPNPFHEEINVRVQLGNAVAPTLQLFDFSGRWLQSVDCSSLSDTGVLEQTVSLAARTPGIYFLRLQHADGLQTVRLLKME